MKRASIIFLQAVIALIGIDALAFLIWEPQVEGRNLHATFFEIYFTDLFLVWAYTGSIAVFIALHQAFILLGRIGQNELFSPRSAQAARRIKYCALTVIGFIAPAVAYLMIIRPGDDIAGGVAMGIMISLISLVVAAKANVLEGIIRSGINIKS